MRLIDDRERRFRLARQGLAEAYRFEDSASATRAVTVLHATEAATVYLSLWARVPGLKVDDVDAALYDDRSLVKQQAMRRTLFVFPRHLLPAAWGSACARGAGMTAARLAKEIEMAGLASDGVAYIAAARHAVVMRLAGGEQVSGQALRAELPEMSGRVTVAEDKKWGGEFPIGSRLLSLFGAEALIARGVNQGSWQSNRPLWTSMRAWLGEDPKPLEPRAGYALLVRAWLATFGPGTITDISWWLGSTVGAVKAALTDTGAVEVMLEDDQAGWVLPEDLEPVPDPGPWGALLPVLDPTVMGWKRRGFYLGEHGPRLFDTNGNAGTTVWWNGRVIGAWTQGDRGEVELRLLEDPGLRGRQALKSEASRLTDWLGGQKVSMIYKSPLQQS